MRPWATAPGPLLQGHLSITAAPRGDGIRREVSPVGHAPTDAPQAKRSESGTGSNSPREGSVIPGSEDSPVLTIKNHA